MPEEAVELGTYLQNGVSATKGSAAVTASRMREAVVSEAGRLVYSAYGWDHFVTDDGPFGAFLVDHDSQMIHTSLDTWDLLSYEPRVKYNVLHDLRRGSAGVKILPSDTGPLLEALRAKSLMDQANVVVVDALATMEEKAKKLIVEAASVNENGASPAMRRVFHVRFAELLEEWEDLQHRMARIRDVIDLASDAVAA